jgi:hypothetical protein
MLVEIEGEHLFRITCPKKHSSILGLRQPRFKILYESGALALLDGYYREAVASFASALERFHEYWVRATFLHAGVPVAAIDDTWKLVARQSERQYGAFLFLYLRERGKTPPHLPDKWVAFRNDVTHSGVFPSRGQTADYAEQVLKLISQLNHELEQLAPAGIKTIQSDQEKAIAGIGAHPTAIETIVGRSTNLWPKQPTFQDEVDLLEERRHGTGGFYLTSA